jgi:EcoRII C terminal
VLEADQYELLGWIRKSPQILIKKLARNDCAWADGAEFGHQNGVFIPKKISESGFFPARKNLNPDKPHIFEVSIPTLWPLTGECKQSRLVHYSNKGGEIHFTGVPKEHFAGLTPASLLIGGAFHDGAAIAWWFMVLDSALPAASFVESSFGLETDFTHGLFSPDQFSHAPQDQITMLIEELTSSLKNGTLPEFISSAAAMPATELLAGKAQREYMRQHGLKNLNPFELEKPGDAIMKISRDIEYALFKQAELRFRAAEVVRLLTARTGGLVDAIVRGYPELDAIFLSASQTRKSRAGLSFEKHLARVLTDGGIRHEEQVITGNRRPDFVLPDVKTLLAAVPGDASALVLSAKTTLRERWKQVTMEKSDSPLFLATVDDRISAPAIADMQEQKICLVVPEALKKAKESHYANKDNVITFRDFFDEQIKARRPYLLLQTWQAPI